MFRHGNNIIIPDMGVWIAPEDESYADGTLEDLCSWATTYTVEMHFERVSPEYVDRIRLLGFVPGEQRGWPGNWYRDPECASQDIAEYIESKRNALTPQEFAEWAEKNGLID